MAAERYGLPENLPVPVDDGSAAHLVGLRVPAQSFPLTAGGSVNLGSVGDGRWVLFIYPSTGVPGEEMPPAWDDIPGARGCTPEACGFRDSFLDLQHAGLVALYGLSVQEGRHQHEAAERLRLPYPLLSDPGLELARSLGLPVFRAGGKLYYKRLTMVVRDHLIEHVFFPIFPPHEHAREVLRWIQQHPTSTAAGA